MKKLIALLLLGVNFVLYAQEPVKKEISNSLTENHIAVSGTKCSLIPPDGYTKSSRFNGFQHSEIGASIMVIEIPAPFSQAKMGLTEEGLKSQGMKLIKKQELTFNDFPALYIEAEQTAYGVLVTKYILTFGSEQQTTMINASFQKTISSQNKENLRRAILSVVYEEGKDVNPLEELSYEVNIDNTKLKYAHVMANSILYTVDGKVPTQSDDKTFFTVAASLSQVDIQDKKQFSINRLRSILKDNSIDPTQIEQIEIDGLNGYLMRAKKSSSENGNEEQVLFTALYSDNSYYLLIGIANDQFEENMDLFKKVSKTFKRK